MTVDPNAQSPGVSNGSQSPPAHSIQFGELFMVDWSPGRGSEQIGVRPAVIVQNDPFNANTRYPNTVVVAVSKSGRAVPTHVEVPKSNLNGLWEATSYVKCEQIQTISKDRLGKRLGKLSKDEADRVKNALKAVFNLR